MKRKAIEQGNGVFQVQYVTKESLYESVQSEGDPNFPKENLVNQMEVASAASATLQRRAAVGA